MNFVENLRNKRSFGSVGFGNHPPRGRGGGWGCTAGQHVAVHQEGVAQAPGVVLEGVPRGLRVRRGGTLRPRGEGGRKGGEAVFGNKKEMCQTHWKEERRKGTQSSGIKKGVPNPLHGVFGVLWCIFECVTSEPRCGKTTLLPALAGPIC